jgi:SAM-dependent methyltransferase
MRVEDKTSPFVRKCISALALKPSAMILDAPSGYGRHAHWLASLGYRVWGTDIDEIRLSEAAATAPRTKHPIHWHVSDLEEPWKSRRKFDLFVVVHFYSPHIVNRAREVLRPGGGFIYESFGGHGKNYLSLPKRGLVERMLARDFEVLELAERPLGPRKTTAAVKALAVRRGL